MWIDRNLATNAAVAFARVGTAEAYALAEVYYMYGGLRNDYTQRNWTSWSRLYVRMGLKEEFVPVMRMCTDTTFRTRKRVALVRQAAETGCVVTLRAALRSIADELPRGLDVESAVARTRFSAEWDVQQAKDQVEASIGRARRTQERLQRTKLSSDNSIADEAVRRARHDEHEREARADEKRKSEERIRRAAAERAERNTRAAVCNESRVTTPRLAQERGSKKRASNGPRRVVAIEAARQHATDLKHQEALRIEDAEKRVEYLRMAREIGGS